MNGRTKEVMKFLAGLSAGAALAHFVFGRTGVLPLKVLGFTLTPSLNGLLVCMGATLSMHLAYYAWRKHPRGDGGSDAVDANYVPRCPPSRTRSLR